MRLSAELSHLSTLASGRAHWVCPEVLKALESAARADNTAVALALYRSIQADLLFLSTAVSNALDQCERDLRDDENAPAIQEFISVLKRATAPRLRVVGK